MENSKTKRGEDIVCTEAEWRAALDAVRCISPGNGTVTEEQKRFILYAKNNNPPVSYSKMVKIWVKNGWPKVSTSFLRCHYLRMKEGGE